MLRLALGLLDRAEQDAEHRIPVVFLLSSWATQRRPLADWLVDELHEQYDISRKIAQAWVDKRQILPLLDGLDAVRVEYRAACVEAVNCFRQEHGPLPLVVCCQLDAYEKLGTQLRLHRALVVQPLTRARVDSYLVQIGAPLAAMRQTLQDDPALWELLDRPLMVDVVKKACEGEAGETLSTQGTLAERRQHLFATYVDRIFRQGSTITPYTREQTERWLAWLAWQMTQHNQTVFHLERLQPDWLPQKQRWGPTQGTSLVAVLLGGGLLGLLGWLLGSLGDGLVFGLVGGLIGGLVGYSGEIRSIEFVRWTWSEFGAELFFPSRRGLFVGLLGGLLAGHIMWLIPRAGTGLTGLGVGLSFLLVNWLGVRPITVALVLLLVIMLGPPSPEINPMSVGLAVGFTFGSIYKLCAAFIAGLSSGEISTKNTPNEGIYRSARIAVISGLGGGLLAGLLSGMIFGLVGGLADGPRTGLLLGLRAGLLGGLAIALWIGLTYGGRACLQHLVLRFLLRYHDSMPWRYVDFLDHTAKRVFLHKIGGGYIFRHPLLQDYFSTLYKE